MRWYRVVMWARPYGAVCFERKVFNVQAENAVDAKLKVADEYVDGYEFNGCDHVYAC